MQCLVAVGSTDTNNAVARTWGHPKLRLYSRRNNVSAAGYLKRQDSLLCKEDIALEAAALVLRADLIDHARYAHIVRARDGRLDEDDVVELQELVWLDRDPPLKWRCALGSKDSPDRLALVLRHTPPRG
jgi:hypothetical protein